MIRFRPIHCVALAFLGAFLFLGGCDNTLDPISDEGAFTIHGALNASTERQFIRVRDLNSPLTAKTTRKLDATVRVENLETGAITSFQDSVVAFGGVYTHNFWADLDVQPNTEYRVVVDRSDGASSEAAMTTPPVVEVNRRPTEGHCLNRFSIRFRGVKELNLIRAQVGFRYQGRAFWVPWPSSFGSASSTADVHVLFQPETVLATQIESQDNPSTRFRVEPRCLKLSDNQIYVAFQHLGPAWSGHLPGNLSYDPTESDVVENGLGFFGGLREDTVSVTVDTSSVIFIGPG